MFSGIFIFILQLNVGHLGAVRFRTFLSRHFESYNKKKMLICWKAMTIRRYNIHTIVKLEL